MKLSSTSLLYLLFSTFEAILKPIPQVQLEIAASIAPELRRISQLSPVEQELVLQALRR